jgi:hypothetical protein
VVTAHRIICSFLRGRQERNKRWLKAPALALPAGREDYFCVTLTQLSAFVMVARLGSVKDAAKWQTPNQGRHLAIEWTADLGMLTTKAARTA